MSLFRSSVLLTIFVIGCSFLIVPSETSVLPSHDMKSNFQKRWNTAEDEITKINPPKVSYEDKLKAIWCQCIENEQIKHNLFGEHLLVCHRYLTESSGTHYAFIQELIEAWLRENMLFIQCNAVASNISTEMQSNLIAEKVLEVRKSLANEGRIKISRNERAITSTNDEMPMNSTAEHQEISPNENLNVLPLVIFIALTAMFSLTIFVLYMIRLYVK